MLVAFFVRGRESFCNLRSVAESPRCRAGLMDLAHPAHANGRIAYWSMRVPGARDMAC